MPALLRGINMLSRCATMYRTEQLNGGDELLGIHHSYVLAICNHPGMSQDKLAQHLCVNKSNITRHLAYLEKNGYVERKVSPTDKRERLVYPTEKMLDLFVSVRKITTDWNNMITEDVSEEELELFFAVLDKMIARSKDIVYRKGGKE